MDGHLPLSLRLALRPAVIVDASLALTPPGLLAALALARTAQVWLPRGFYTLLDNDAHYRAHPRTMGATWLPEAERAPWLEAMAAELDAWRRAWHNGRLSARVHWLGDAQYESLLPDRADAALLPRFEYCCAALDRRGEDAGRGAAAGPIDECARDVAALAAALQPEPAYVLTRGGVAGAVPPLLDWLEARGVGGTRAASVDLARGALDPALVPLGAARTEAAVVEIVAPAAVAIGDVWEEGDWDELDGAGDEDRRDWPADPWRGACAVWQPVAALEAAA